jgi:hypothetical protein
MIAAAIVLSQTCAAVVMRSCVETATSQRTIATVISSTAAALIVEVMDDAIVMRSLPGYTTAATRTVAATVEPSPAAVGMYARTVAVSGVICSE